MTLTPIVVERGGVETKLEVDAWVVTGDRVLSFFVPQPAFRPLLSALGGELEYHRVWFSVREGELEWLGCRVVSWFRNNTLVIQAYSAVLWPWWHCPSCGEQIQCPVERMNDGKCIDCNEPMVEGRLSEAQRAELLRSAAETLADPFLAQAVDELAAERRAEFFRLAAEAGDPVLVDPSHPAVVFDPVCRCVQPLRFISQQGTPCCSGCGGFLGPVTRSPQCPWCYELDGMHLFGCVAERTRQQLEAEKAWKARRQ